MKDDPFYLSHIRDAIGRIQAYTAGGRAAFFADTLIQDAVMRNLEIIGEATKRLTAGTTEQMPNIPWRQIAGMRDVLIHHYFGIDLKTVWEVVEQHLAPLDVAAAQLLNPPSSSSSSSSP